MHSCIGMVEVQPADLSNSFNESEQNESHVWKKNLKLARRLCKKIQMVSLTDYVFVAKLDLHQKNDGYTAALGKTIVGETDGRRTVCASV